MTRLSRRSFLALAAGGLALSLGEAGGAPASRGPAASAKIAAKIAMIHVTDLFRPHADPDDHWDLACVYALAAQRLELAGIMIDHPPVGLNGDPDVLAVAQMNQITGRSVPVFVGSPHRMDPAEAIKPENRTAANGAFTLLRLLKESRLPAIINILGSSRDVALAAKLEPKLFTEKCAGIYLNAGSGTPDKALAARREYNVVLDPASYAAIFEIPCPIYWLPCFDVAPGDNGEPFVPGPRGSYYAFQQKEILPHLSPRLQNYFAFTFKQGRSENEHQKPEDALRPNWLRYLDGPAEKDLLERQGNLTRNMWCTAGFLHAAGLTVTADGTIAPLASVRSPLFDFEPVRVTCDAEGITSWSAAPESKHHYLFRVRNTDRYGAAMTTAMREILRTLP